MEGCNNNFHIIVGRMVYVYVKGKEIIDAFRLTLGKKNPSLKPLGKHLFSKAKMH